MLDEFYEYERKNDLTLMPCPFCGHSAQVGQFEYSSRWLLVHNAEDGNCPASGMRAFVTREDAVEFWNMRAPLEDQLYLKDGHIVGARILGVELVTKQENRVLDFWKDGNICHVVTTDGEEIYDYQKWLNNQTVLYEKSDDLTN